MIYLSLRNPNAPTTADYAWFLHPCIEVECISCGRMHDKLWTIKRRGYPSGLWWPYIKLNGERVLLDSSLPTEVTRLPRDAKEVSPEAAALVWHEDNESHVFGGPNVAKALREAIAEANAR